MDNQSYESDQENAIGQPVRSKECFDDNHDEEFVSNLHDEVQSVDLNQEFVSNVHDEDEPVVLNQEFQANANQKKRLLSSAQGHHSDRIAAAANT
ncbi:hypothetical protein L1887_36217 [Cichorium endivia]|nr:hypothetical protein L1887_36217 [Cichorium endivia]